MNARPGIDCLEDTITYNCSIFSNQESPHIIWHVTFPHLMPLNFTLDLANPVNDRSPNFTARITNFRPDEYIESTITFRAFDFLGTVVECEVRAEEFFNLKESATIPIVQYTGK